ncbi:MAG: hypothetical protein COY58_08590 [Gammaproteobacteria bacterium CG_4_10_14_0_8_um_filter_38_16]|nr:MAG: hypothetical protein COY58_08590 [Gammaproteobacteria bacterium CG_4_10_14_0_8_um_filter_38_16]PJA03313.1 MAG: hypothetical protein COX72_05805 [Gammaproteobacteria bacterium CG_4_10_14_0_2_um_filter_38_22]PJB09638.1 MAG: hypothetical protein CO120_09050 [Gammaproteobacteria bacterium CG_4_9_14_3_um_filter_38_9]
MSKKKFSISPAVNKALTQTIQMAEAENSNFFNTEILIDRISLDSENPRKQKITLRDLKSGLSSSDPQYAVKKDEYDGLCELAESIKREGLLNPISVIEEGSNFKMVAGERRFLATIIAGKKVIEARVFRKKPKPLDLRVIQWSENQSRKDLSLHDKLMNVSAILEAYRSEKQEELTAIRLSEVISISRQQAQYFKAILSNAGLMKFIKDERVSTFEMARKLAPLELEQIHKRLNEIFDGVDNKDVHSVISKDKSKNAGRKRAAVNLGSTKKPFVAKTIAETMLSTNQFSKYAQNFRPVDWTCLDQSTKAFKKLVEIMEKELGAIV